MIKSVFKKLINTVKLEKQLKHILSHLNLYITKEDYQCKIIALPQHKGLYFAIPKVANSSLREIWSELLNVDVNYATRNLVFPAVKKSKVDKYKDYYKFCFVRNPWDRLVSCYSDKVKDKEYDEFKFLFKEVPYSILKPDSIQKKLTFEMFANLVVNIPDEYANTHFKSQSFYITDENGKLLVDFIGKFERLGEDFLYICEKLGISDITLPHKKKSNRKSYQEYYSSHLKDLIKERYIKDLEMFGYEF